MTYFSALTQLSDETLHGEVKRLVGRANTLMAELLAHLGDTLAAEQDFGRDRIRELQKRRKKDLEGLGPAQHPPAPE
jgi:hypothetical protein